MSATKVDWTKVNQPELTFQRFPSRRSQVYSTKGIVSCSQPLAAEAGLEILRKGGNAGMSLWVVQLSIVFSLSDSQADAAVATSVALNVTEPSCCGIGGSASFFAAYTITDYTERDAFCLFYDAQTKVVKALNGSGRAPKRLTLDYLRKRGITGTQIPLIDLNSVTVPGRLIPGAHCTR